MANQRNAHKLLDRLATDDEFRARMEADPVAALAEYGFHVDPTIAPYAVMLPSKEHIRENADLLASQLVATSGWIVFSR